MRFRPHTFRPDAKLMAMATPYLALSSAVVVTDLDQKIVACNDRYCEATGYPREELVGRPLSFDDAPAAWANSIEQMYVSLAGSGRWNGYLPMSRRDGREWVAHFSVTPIELGEMRLGYVSVVNDSTGLCRRGAGERAGLKGMTFAPEAARAQESALGAFRQWLTAVARIAEVRDPDVQGHLDRVQAVVRWLVAAHEECSEWSAEEREWVAVLSVLHDLGKVAIPEGILFKPGPLTPEERHLVERHTVTGEELIRHLLTIPGLEEWTGRAAEIARWHHERWDGTGYPDGLAGESIPLPARIVALADVVDALLSRRAYKDRWSWDQAVNYVGGQAGRQFDPSAVQTLLEVCDLVHGLYPEPAGTAGRPPSA